MKTRGVELLTDFKWHGRLQRPTLRRAVRHRLAGDDPSIRVIAEDFLAETSNIDLLAVGAEGEIVSLRIGRDGDDVSLLTQCLADLAWLHPRVADFLKLAPTLGLEPTAEPRALLLCPDFAPETLAAVGGLPARSLGLVRYYCLESQGQPSVLLKTWNPPSSATDGRSLRADSSIQASSAEVSTRSTRSSSPAVFRTGLTDADVSTGDQGEKILT